MSPWLAGKLCEPMDAPRPQIERVSDVKALRDQTVVEDESKTRYGEVKNVYDNKKNLGRSKCDSKV